MSSSESSPDTAPAAPEAARLVRQLLAHQQDSGQPAAVEGLIEGLRPEELQAALTLLGRTFAEWYQRGEAFVPMQDDLTATEAVMLCHGILDAADLEMFELSMWHPFPASSRS